MSTGVQQLYGVLRAGYVHVLIVDLVDYSVYKFKYWYTRGRHTHARCLWLGGLVAAAAVRRCSFTPADLCHADLLLPAPA